MRKLSRFCLLAAAFCFGHGQATLAAPQSAPSSALAGPITLDYSQGAAYLGSHAVIRGNIRLNSPSFGAQAETATLDFIPSAHGKKGVSIARAALEPLPGGQVSGHFDDIAQGRNYRFRADHAVYVPDPAHPGGGQIKLDGHVQIAVNAPIALDGPFLTSTDHAVVRLGSGPAYPQVETGAGHVTFTPLNGGQ